MIDTFFIEDEVVDKKFYVHVNMENLQIMGVSPHCDNTSQINIEIDKKLAIDFLTGDENITQWAIILDKDSYSVVKRSSHIKFKNNRIDTLPISLLPFECIDFPDIDITLCTVSNAAIIRYNGDTIRNLKNSVNLYFTREDDPMMLKSIFKLDAAFLSEISFKNNSPGWPKEIKIPISNIDDTSIFTVRSTLKISLQKI